MNVELSNKLDELANKLVPVAGLLMHVACSNGRVAREPEIHEEDCKCQVCCAFLSVHDVINQLTEIIKNSEKQIGQPCPRCQLERQAGLEDDGSSACPDCHGTGIIL